MAEMDGDFNGKNDQGVISIWQAMGADRSRTSLMGSEPSVIYHLLLYGNFR